jgi:hypothetical protein
MVTSTGTGQATEKTQIHNFIDNSANQVHAQNVQGRMFGCLLVVCQRFLGRARELFAEQEFGRELTARWLRPRGTTAIAMAVLSFLTLAHRTGVPVQHMDQRAPFGLIRIWSAAEHEVIHLQKRVREDYQGLQLIYQMARRIRNLPEPKELYEQRATPGSNQCRITNREAAKGRAPERAAKAIARNRLLCSFSWDGRTRRAS